MAINLANPVNWQHPLNRGLRCWVRNHRNIAGRAAPALINGAAISTNPYTGYGYVLDGSNDYVSLGTTNDLDVTAAATIAISFRFSSIANEPMLFSKQSGMPDVAANYRAELFSGSVYITTGGGYYHDQYGAAYSFSNDVWYRYVGSWDTRLYQYINGVQLGSQAMGYVPAASTGVCELGECTVKGAGRSLNGRIADFKIWNRRLSDDEVKLEYYQWLQGYPALTIRHSSTLIYLPAASSFKSAWAKNANTIIQPLVSA